MTKNMPIHFAAALALMAAPAFCQMRDNQERSLSCNDNHWGDHRHVHHCEMREQPMAVSGGPVQIEPGMNGGISVKGWSRGDMLVRSRIDTSALSDAEAKGMVSQIQIAGGAGSIKAHGPENDHDRNWSVSYEIFVPWSTDLVATSHSGGIHIQDVRGRVHFETVNGGVALARVAGDVSGKTTNGGLKIDLEGTRWDGQGLDVQTTNGGVHMNVPANYSAHVETSTVNGGMSVDFPISVQGKITKQLSFDINGGGPTLKVSTTNGGVHIGKS